jgi:hypothetical protein
MSEAGNLNGRPVMKELDFSGFSETTVEWGFSETRNELPKIDDVSNVYYAPYIHNGPWGIFNSHNELIESAVDRTFPNDSMIFQDGKSPVDYQEITGEAPIESYIYGGRFNPHFGHFLIEVLPRYWMLATEQTFAGQILVHTNAHLDFFESFPFARSIFQGLGLSKDRFVGFDQPTKSHRLTIPNVSFRAQTFGHPIFQQLCRKIGHELLKSRNIEFQTKPVWLSKAKLTAGVSTTINEGELDIELSNLGFDILYPETMDFVDQVSLFYSRRKIFGTTGSAFHVALFAPPIEQMVLVDPVVFKNSNFSIFDKLNSHNSKHIFPIGTEMIEPIPNFIRTLQLPNPRKMAQALAELAGLPTQPIKAAEKKPTPLLQEGVDGTTDSNRMPQPVRSTVNSNAHALNDIGPHNGHDYKEVLKWFHNWLAPQTYLEIGTLTGGTLSLADCPSIAIDPQFQITSDVIGKKRSTLFYQVGSDQFFRERNPSQLLGSAIDLVYLDGMHWYEFLLRDFINTEKHAKRNSVIIMHDCIPTNLYYGRRVVDSMADLRERVAFPGWWAGDVWKTVELLKRARPDLRIHAYNAPPTGLVCVTNLDSSSEVLEKNYSGLIESLMDQSYDGENFKNYISHLDIRPTEEIGSPDKISKYFWL